MLQIRAAQMEVFRRQSLERFVERMIRLFRGEREDLYATVPDEAVRAEVESGLAQARRYGMTTEGQVERFLCHRLVIGRDFAADPANGDLVGMLELASVLPEEKLEMLDARADEIGDEG